MSLKHGLLGLLNYGDMTGYELNKAFEDSLGFFWRAQTSQIYRELTVMEKSGWLISRIEVPDDKPNKRIYTLTPEGKVELDKWLSQEQNSPDPIRDSFLMRVFFSGERPIKENLKMLQAFKDECKKALLFMEGTDENVQAYERRIQEQEKSLYWGMTISFGRAYYEMCIKWAEETIQVLEGKMR